MDKYKEYGRALREYQEYKDNIDNRIKAFNENIADKEKEVSELQTKYTNDFLNGTITSDTNIKDLKIEIAYLKEQLEMITSSIKTDEKIRLLADNVLSEYKELIKISSDEFIKEDDKIEQLEKEYIRNKEKVLADREHRKRYIYENLIYPRLKVIPYMDNITKMDKYYMENGGMK